MTSQLGPPSLLLNVWRQFDSETVVGQTSVFLKETWGGREDLHEEGVDVVLQVGLLPGLTLDALLQSHDRLNQIPLFVGRIVDPLYGNAKLQPNKNFEGLTQPN